MTDWQDDLDAFDPDETGWDVSEQLQAPADADTADAMLRRRARAEREVARIRATAERERERIKAWEADRTAGLERRVESLSEALEGYARAVGRKTLHLPHGVLKLSKARTSVVILDTAAFRDWAEGNGRVELLNIKVTPAKPALAKLGAGPVKDAMTAAADLPADAVLRAIMDGDEIVPGVALLDPVRETFSIAPPPDVNAD